jgi:tetratricopeptide (TPR) repeat protein
MEWSSLSTVIEIEAKQYAVETLMDAPHHRITSTIRHAGRSLSQREVDLPEGLDEDTLRQRFRDFHRNRSVELEAIFRLGRKIDERPTVDAFNKLGVILLANGFYEDASQRFRRAVEMTPGNSAVLKNYGIALSFLGDHEGALAAFHQARELGPGFADLYYHIGNTHIGRMELDAATQHYLQALQINPRYADARLKLGATCVGYLVQAGASLPEGKAHELESRAMSEIDTAAKLNPKVRNRAFLMAQDAIRQKNYELAFQKLMEVRPPYVPRVGDEVIFFFTLTLLYGSEGIDLAMTEQYIDKLGAVIEEYPHYADLHQHLGVAHLIKMRFVVARTVRELKKALEINPGMVRAQETLVEAEELHRRVLATLKKAIITT